MSQQHHPEDQLMQWITAKWVTKPIQIVAELGIADLLQDGPLTAEVLSEKTETHAPSLYRLLRALSAVGFLVETGDRAFELTPLGRCLQSDAMRPLARMFLSSWHDKAWDGLAHSVKTGQAGFDHIFGQPSFQWLEENPDARAAMDQGQGLKAVGFAQAVMEANDFSDCATICDVGGGMGAFLMQILGTYSRMEGIVADMPATVAAAQQAIAEAQLQNRCKATAYDFLEQPPPPGDGYFLVNILHDWEDAICRRILKNISRSMTADTRLWIVEYLLEPEPGFSVAKLLDLEVLVMGGGRERTLEEYEALLSSAGLSVSRVTPTHRDVSLLECKRTTESATAGTPGNAAP